MVEPSVIADAEVVEEIMISPEMISEEQTAASSPQAGAKADLLTILNDGLMELSAKRVAVNELLLQLERGNPTQQPARSPLLNGVWEVTFAGLYGPGLLDSPTREFALLLYTGGFSAGVVMQFLNKLPPPLASQLSLNGMTVEICRDQPRVESTTKVRVLGSEQTVVLSSQLEVESDVRLKELFTQSTLLNLKLPLSGPAKFSRDLYVTYLDKDLLVVRDASGVPDVLLRKDKDFQIPAVEEPDAQFE